MNLKEQEFESEIRNGETDAQPCYYCNKIKPLKEYTIRQNFSDKKIMCCSDECAQYAQMGAE